MGFVPLKCMTCFRRWFRCSGVTNNRERDEVREVEVEVEVEVEAEARLFLRLSYNSQI